MTTGKRTYGTRELATLMGIDETTARRRARREGWRSVPRKGRGGGHAWLLESMPDSTRREIALAVACRAASEGRKHFAPGVNARRGRPLSGLSERGRRVAEARAFIVRAARSALESGAGKPTALLAEFAALYRRREAPAPAWVYEAQRKISRTSILTWMRRLDAEGPRGLANRHENRSPKSPVNANPRLKEFVLGMLYKYPHISGAELQRGIVGRFGPGGKEESPSSGLPSLRATQRWIQEWRGDHKRDMLARENPDESRSRRRAAFGDAAGHVIRLNQEWQSDGTLCELMLSDGRRHTLNLTLDVYSRRLCFHVSRTSSSAAVASCLRKAILAWGVPETWKTDNGSDYTSEHMERLTAILQIFHEKCPPFSPEKKPFVERAFRTFLHSHVEVMAGYLGHNVAERRGIEARRSFAERLHKKLKTPGQTVEMRVSPEELQRVCDAWAENVYGSEPHAGLGGMTPSRKAAEWRGPVARVENERALDLLLLPAPGNGGIRTVTKKGLRITLSLYGLKVGGHYIGTDLTPLIGQRVLCRMDDMPGRVFLFDPETDEYLGRAEHPGIMGWKADQIRDVALAAARKQKAEDAAMRKAWKKTAARADVADIGNEILAAAAFRAKAAPVPAHGSVIHTTPALEQAALAARADEAPAPSLTPERAEECRAAAREAMKIPWRIPESDARKYEEWQRIDALLKSDENAVPLEQAKWWKAWGTTGTFRNFDLVLGERARQRTLEPAKAKTA